MGAGNLSIAPKIVSKGVGTFSTPGKLIPRIVEKNNSISCLTPGGKLLSTSVPLSQVTKTFNNRIEESYQQVAVRQGKWRYPAHPSRSKVRQGKWAQ